MLGTYDVYGASRDAALRQFATEHLTTETSHLQAFHNWLPMEYHSRLLPIWRAAGWLTGALPALFGSHAVYVTIAAVETFVEQHYNAQIARLENDPLTQPLAVSLASFCADEVAHRRDADRRIGNVGPIGRVWQHLIAIGSRAGVAVARRI